MITLKKYKRLWAIFSVLLLSVALLVACTKVNDEVNSVKQKHTITFSNFILKNEMEYQNERDLPFFIEDGGLLEFDNLGTPKNEGYRFLFWTDSKDNPVNFFGDDNSQKIEIHQSFTMYAVWIENSDEMWVVIFSDTESQPQRFSYITVLDNQTIDDSELEDWVIEVRDEQDSRWLDDDGLEFDFATKILNDTVLQAEFDNLEHQIDEGESVVMRPLVLIVDSQILAKRQVVDKSVLSAVLNEVESELDWFDRDGQIVDKDNFIITIYTVLIGKNKGVPEIDFTLGKIEWVTTLGIKFEGLNIREQGVSVEQIESIQYEFFNKEQSFADIFGDMGILKEDANGFLNGFLSYNSTSLGNGWSGTNELSSLANSNSPSKLTAVKMNAKIVLKSGSSYEIESEVKDLSK
ncbi:MAG: hypothetical protein LBU60_06595 [Clostridiales bacterium]|nr:hypothetical protein [Clostridiales bacterium]